MKRTSLVMMVVAISICASVGAEDPEKEGTPPGKPTAEASAPQVTILDRPFTADQIREEWIEGLRLKVHRRTADVEVFEEWTVIKAGADGVDIQSVKLDAAGNATGEPKVQHSGWVELRDHASFPADRASRREVEVRTPLGVLDGWLYVVGDPASGTVNEFFFAKDLPGAPVFVHVHRDQELVEVFEQVERERPAPKD